MVDAKQLQAVHGLIMYRENRGWVEGCKSLGTSVSVLLAALQRKALNVSNPTAYAAQAPLSGHAPLLTPAAPLQLACTTSGSAAGEALCQG